jgi:hypothetical protein
MMMKRLISTWWTCGSMVRPLNAVAVGLQGQSARDSERLRGISDCRGLDGAVVSMFATRPQEGAHG